MIASAKPKVLPVDPGGLPRELTEGKRFVVWKLEPEPKKPGEWTKPPYQASNTSEKASSTNADTWSTFAEAFMAYQADPAIDGVGRTMGDGITGIDLDKAVGRDEQPKPWAREIMDRIPGYWERSPLGHGYRGLCRATLPPGRRKVKYRDGVVEMYDSGRYLTLTGRAVRVVDELPELQAEVEALHADVMGGESVAAAAVVTTMTGAAESVSPEGMALLERMMGGRYGDQVAKVWAGDYSDFDDDESNAEWAFAKEATYHAMALGYAGDDLARIIEELMRAGPYRPKWDSPRTVTVADGETVRTTWLGMTIGRAIRAREQTVSLGPLSLNGCRANDQEDTAAAEPTETPEQIIARLERELAKCRAVVAGQQTIIRAQRAKIDELKALRDEDRRLRLAERKLDQVKGFSANQKSAIKVSAGIVTSAVSRDVAPQVITRGMIAEEMGCHEATAGAALKVFDLPGSPIRRMNVRTNELDEDGMARPKIVTRYYAETPCPADIIEAMAAIGEALEGRCRRYDPKRCPKHPDAETYTQTRCSVCHDLVGGEESPCERVAPMDPTPLTVAVPLPITSESLLWGDSPNGQANGTNGHTNGAATLTAPHRQGTNPDLAEHAARVTAAMAQEVGAVREVPDSAFVAAPSKPQRPPEPLRWCCPCTSINRVRRATFGDWICDGCGVAAPSPEERP